MSSQQDLYYAKYLKYKEKYISLKEQIKGGGLFGSKKILVSSVIAKIKTDLENIKMNLLNKGYYIKYNENTITLDKFLEELMGKLNNLFVTIIISNKIDSKMMKELDEKNVKQKLENINSFF